MPASFTATITSVRESWMQDEDGWLHQSVPQAEGMDKHDQMAKVTYLLPLIANAMQSGGSAHPWEPGQNPGVSVDDEKGDVTYANKGYETDVKEVPTRHTDAIVFRDARNRTRQVMQYAFQHLSGLVATLMKNVAIFGAALSFAGGTLQSGSATDPHKDIEDALAGDLRDHASQFGFSLEMKIGVTAARMLASYVQYSGSGTGSAIAKSVPIDQLAMLIQQQHGFDRVDIIQKNYSTQEIGQPRTLSRLMDFIWIGVVDRTQGSYRVIPGQDMVGPGGAVCLFQGRGQQPYIEEWRPEGTGVTKFSARGSADAISPFDQAEGAASGVQLGKWWDAAAIFDP